MRFSAFCLVFVLASLMCFSGCGGGGGGSAPTLYQVEGKITLSGKPLEFGNVSLQSADPKVGSWTGLVNSGTYSVSASPGQYKVTVTPPPADDSAPKSFIDAKYQDIKKTPLTLEVVASPAPGAYDLKLTK